MRKVMLVCGLGMSTSLIINKAKKEAVGRGIEDLDFIASNINEYEKNLKTAGVEVCLVGPQARYVFKQVQSLGKKHNVKCDLINPNDFSTLNGRKVLDHALRLLAE